MRTTLRTRIVMSLVAGAGALIAAAVIQPSALAQQQPPAQPAPQDAAPIDLTGVWVSVVTEEWRWRMVTPPKGDYATIPLTDEARRAADGWDPARDTAEGNACRAYGAIGIMRIPARFRVSWEDPQTLKMEVDAGQQTRLFRFTGAAPAAAGTADWQGVSTAQWLLPGGVDPIVAAGRGGRGGGGGFGQVGALPPVGPGRAGGAANAAAPAPPPRPRGGSLRVQTANMRPGYIRKNGVPYSENATMTEYFVTQRTPDGNQWLTVTQMVRDPRYIQGEYVTNWHYKKEPDSSKWRPTPCSAA